MRSLLTPLFSNLPPVLVQFLSFAVIGVIGLGVDTAALYLALYGLGAGFYSARLISFLLAATATWSLNRRYTFRDSQPEPLFRQWLRFLATNAFGGAVNYAVYAGLIAWGGTLSRALSGSLGGGWNGTVEANLFAAHPVLAVAAGSIAGMMFNFIGSRHLVFSRNLQEHP